MKQESKKGIPLQMAFSAVLIVLLIGVLVIVGIVLFQALTSVQSSTSTVTNEAVTMTSAGVVLSNFSNCGYITSTVTNVANATNQLVSGGNYTYTAATGTLVNLTGSGSAWKVNYSVTDGGSVCTGSTSMITQFSGYIVLVGLIGTIIFLGIVIGVLISSFAAGKSKL
jgi:flagellar biosynthesis protein FliQ